jgi:hypothetical protein
MALPIPLPPPVTMAILFSRRICALYLGPLYESVVTMVPENDRSSNLSSVENAASALLRLCKYLPHRLLKSHNGANDVLVERRSQVH